MSPRLRHSLAALALLVAASCRAPGPAATDDADPRLGPYALALTRFDELSWDALTPEPVPLPDRLRAAVDEDLRLRFHDRARFRDEVMGDSRRIGFDEARVATLAPREAVIHAVDLVTSRLDFALVDSAEFRGKYPSRLFPEIDLYYHEREGDCDKYRDLVKAVFALLKEKSADPRIANAYVVSQSFGGADAPHAWNAILLSLPDRIEVAHIDPTWYDGGEPLEAARDLLVSPTTFRLSFLSRIGDYEGALAEIDRVFASCDGWTQEALLARKAALQLRLAELGKGGYGRVLSTLNFAQVTGCDHPYSAYFDRLLSCAVRAYAALGRKGAARRAFERLAREYPRSIYRAVLLTDRSLAGVLASEVRGDGGG